MGEAEILFAAMGRYMNSLNRNEQTEQEGVMNALAIGANLLMNVILGNIGEGDVDYWLNHAMKRALKGKPLVNDDGTASMEKKVVS